MWESLGLENIAVGRVGLLSLCATAHSPSTSTARYLGLFISGHIMWESLGLENIAVGRVGLLL